jgi:4-amino-4-deoxy-L-arabinose transferase-like glycosyltransferase
MIIRRMRTLTTRVDPWLLVIMAAGAFLRFGRIAEFDNSYYTATAVSITGSWHNFLFGSFDPGGLVSVDKPPIAFWLQAAAVGVFGPHKWAVNLPQAALGTLSIAFLYALVRPTFGRVSGLVAAALLATLPAAIVIDSRNEPDALLMALLLGAAFALVHAVRSGRWGWLVTFGVLVGAAFNTKMLVAFVPLPAFALYYWIASRDRIVRRFGLGVAAAAVLLAVSFSWPAFVGLTPASDRPYIGSTRDNSIWTLVFEYNGFNRFGSFGGPGPQQGPQQVQAQPGQLPQGQPQRGQPPQGLQQPQLPGGQPGLQQSAPQAQQPAQLQQAIGQAQAQQTGGVIGLFRGQLASQLGWLLPVALALAAISLVPLLDRQAFLTPSTVVGALRGDTARSEAILWAAWLVSAAFVFGLADATTSHPYYLVGLGVPLAAAAGAGAGVGLRLVQGRRVMAAAVAAAIAAIAAYQVTPAGPAAGEIAVGIALLVVACAALVVLVAVAQRTVDSPLALGAIACAAAALLIMPALAGWRAGGRVAGAGPIGPRPQVQGLPGGQPAGPPPQAGGPQNPPFLAAPGAQGPQGIQTIVTFVANDPRPVRRFAVATVSAREAAPFIIAGIPAAAIGGFSGGDPILTPEAFATLARRGEVLYFLAPRDGQNQGPPGGGGRQQPVLEQVRRNWRDVSVEAGLPTGTLYRAP